MVETINLIIGFVLGVAGTLFMVWPDLTIAHQVQTRPRPERKALPPAREPVGLPQLGKVTERVFHASDYDLEPPGCNRGEPLVEGKRYYEIETHFLDEDGQPQTGELVVCPEHAPFPEELASA